MNGKLLPTTTRALNFRHNAIDNVTGGVTTETSDLTLQVSSSAGPFAVTAPATGVTWDPAINATQTLTWNESNTDAAPVSFANVDVDI